MYRTQLTTDLRRAFYRLSTAYYGLATVFLQRLTTVYCSKQTHEIKIKHTTMMESFLEAIANHFD